MDGRWRLSVAGTPSNDLLLTEDGGYVSGWMVGIDDPTWVGTVSDAITGTLDGHHIQLVITIDAAPVFTFTGTVNGHFTGMAGTLYIQEMPSKPWSATKV